MGKHATHSIHQNTLYSWRELKLTSRNRSICELIAERGPLTDRQIQEALGFEEKNSVSPCITALRDKVVLVEVGKTRCMKFNRLVRTTDLSERVNDD
jgi:hypothetical protein